MFNVRVLGDNSINSLKETNFYRFEFFGVENIDGFQPFPGDNLNKRHARHVCGPFKGKPPP